MSAYEWAKRQAKGGATSKAQTWAAGRAQTMGIDDDYFRRIKEEEQKARQQRAMELMMGAHNRVGRITQKAQQAAQWREENPSLLQQAGRFGRSAGSAVIRTPKEVGSRLSGTIGGFIRDDRSGPGAEEIMRRQEEGKRTMGQDEQKRASTPMLLQDNLKLLEMVRKEAKPKEVNKFIDEAKERKRQEDLRTAGAATEMASYGFGSVGLTQAFRAGGKGAVARAAASTAASGGAGNVGYGLGEDPNMTLKEGATQFGMGAGLGLAGSAALSGVGAGYRGLRGRSGTTASKPLATREIAKPSDARNLMKANIEDIGSIDVSKLRPGREGKFDTFMTGALTLENRTRKEGMGPLGQMVINNLSRIGERSKLRQTLTESFLGGAQVNRAFLKKNDETLFRLGETVTRKELTSQTVEQLARKYNTNPDVIRTLRAGRLHYDEMLELANNARKLRGEAPIKARDNYVPHLQEITKETSDTIFKGTGKKPFFERARTGVESKKSYVEALERYQDALSFDVYMTPIIKEGNELTRVLKTAAESATNPKMAKKLNKSAEWYDKWLREAITKQDVPMLEIGGMKLGVGRGTKSELVLQKMNQVRAINSLVGGFRYLTSTLPASVVQATSEAGITSVVKGVGKVIFSPKARKEFYQLSQVGKAKRAQGIGITAGGQLDFSRGALMKGKTQRVQEFASAPNEVLENFMTNIAWQSGRDKGRKLGLKGKDLDNFSDYVTGISQEIYNSEFRAEILRNLATRSAFPFQTFVVGQFNRLRRFSGTGGGIPLAKRERLYQATTLLVGTALYNQLSEARGLGSTTTVGSLVPLAGGEIDKQLRNRFGADTFAGLTPSVGGFDRDPTAIQGDISTLYKAAEDFIDTGDWKTLRKEGLKWGMGLAGIGGAGQISKTWEGIETMVKGESVTPRGTVRFQPESTAKNWFQALTAGQYGTEEGKKYIQGLNDAKTLEKEIQETLGLKEITITSSTLSERIKQDGSLSGARKLASEHNKNVDGLLEQVRRSSMSEDNKNRLIERLESQKASTKDFALKRRLE